MLEQGKRIINYSHWSRYCCINANLDIGSMIPYVKWAQAQRYSCLIMNPNLSRNQQTKVQS